MQPKKIIKVPNMSNIGNNISLFSKTIYNYYDY
jgi:hypothetical protein